MQHRDKVILNKIKSEIEIAEQLIGNAALEDFMSNELLKRALCMTVINIGELVKNLTLDFRTQHPGVPWRRIAGFRDIAAHKYATLNMSDVYNSIKYDFPDLKSHILDFLSE
ncbi:MAG TPA: DUF86 domain-containing protein [Candidatus Ornithomonoglobus intestinigallinarum]|uniref:DUF86 domain-containing protein n=1 Tax=Candidatus Ornithomonoglobus intestinigallinarum TaxID=2840894 RepID=A0A9D1H129_9FIRM|nr:DUF86 domain-containing protein [Candidatus Ornithomonoglobus intestinigallinarum]